MKLRLGTRGSELALWQANRVKSELEALGAAVELVAIHTTGDRSQSGPIARIGAQGVFTKEIERALLDGRIDLAVHSLKDLPTELAPGLALTAVTKRADVRDVLISREPFDAESLPDGFHIGTGSLRRKCQLLQRFGSRILVSDIRGNIRTRLEKVASGAFDATLLALAGLERLALEREGLFWTILPSEAFYPAVGQGALAIETRASDEPTIEAVQPIEDEPTRLAIEAEREMLLELRGGCIAPVGARTDFTDGVLTLKGRILELDGSAAYDAEAAGPISGTKKEERRQAARELGRSAATRLLALGGSAVIEQIERLRSER